jgi:hypothetical protein
MWIFPSGMKVYLALGQTDMRKSVRSIVKYIEKPNNK